LAKSGRAYTIPTYQQYYTNILVVRDAPDAGFQGYPAGWISPWSNNRYLFLRKKKVINMIPTISSKSSFICQKYQYGTHFQVVK
jgi:hypothetical protein